MLNITNFTRYTNFEETKQLLQWLANRLEITTGEVVLISSSKMLKKFSTNDIELKALLAPTAFENVYNLYLDDLKPSNFNLILCHEMVHLSQYTKKLLKLDLNKKEFTWKGVKYDNSVPYDLRPWENEAYSMQSKLLKEYKNCFKSEKTCIFNIFKKNK